MPTNQPPDSQDLIRKATAALDRQRRRGWIFTFVPVAGAIAFVIVVGTQTANLESERVKQQEAARQAQERKKALEDAISNVGRQLTDLVRATSEIETLIESKQSFLRTLDEARFLIDVRMKFDSIHSALDRLAAISPELKVVRPQRNWVTVVASGNAPASLTVTDGLRPCLGPSDRTAVFRSPNGLHALAVLGDGTFTTAYRLTVSYQSKGCAPGAYFASTDGWIEVRRDR